MGASDDEEEYVVYGTPLQVELESVKGQYAKDVQDKAITKALPVWQQVISSPDDMCMKCLMPWSFHSGL